MARAAFFGAFSPLNAWIPALLIGLILVLLSIFVKNFSPEAAGSGIPHLKSVLKGNSHFYDIKVLLVKFIGGVTSIGCGLALGIGGPTIQMGGSAGSIVSRIFADDKEERDLLICSGAGAGLAAAFNAPLAGLLFVLEELQQKYDKFSLVTAFSATISGTLVCRIIMGQKSIFNFKILEYPALELILWCIILGTLLGFLGLLFNYFLSKTLRKFKGMQIFIALVIGLSFGIIQLCFPDMLGSKTQLITELLTGKFSLIVLIMLFIGKFILTVMSYNVGTPGGIFAPLLLLGALAGAIFFHLVEHFSPARFEMVTFIVLGMGGLFTAIVRSPLSGIILILEMSNQFFLLLPLILVALIAYGIPEYTFNKPVYDELMDLRFDDHKPSD
jgi:H+/Cl- antiporter ClcA